LNIFVAATTRVQYIKLQSSGGMEMGGFLEWRWRVLCPEVKQFYIRWGTHEENSRVTLLYQPLWGVSFISGLLMGFPSLVFYEKSFAVYWNIPFHKLSNILLKCS